MPAARINTAINLQQLLAGIADAPPLAMSGLGDDSRRLKSGDVFVAVQGANSHGLDFAESAIASGVVAIIWDTTTGSREAARGPVLFIGVDDLAAKTGELANRFYDWPSQAVDVTGITGTNGKTTVAFLIAQCLQRLDTPCAYVGTLGSGADELVVDLGLTTPPCLDLHDKLAGFRDEGVLNAAIEVSSHALDQGRLDGVRFGTAIFTNLTRDHVDYHGDMRSYAESKAQLFTDFECRHRIVNVDSQYGDDIADLCGPDVVLTSCSAERDSGGRRFVFARSFTPTATGSRVAIASSWGNADVDVPLPGGFNVSNAIQVLASLLLRDIAFDVATGLLAEIVAPPGRMQAVARSGEDGLPAVFVDYAHTPAALEAALQALRPHVVGGIWCVFGCGGDRDAGKRPLMGEIVSRLADHPVVTNDNPRSEPPQAIVADILAGMHGGAMAIEDRAAAIAYAIREARSDDAVLIAGKGHENYQLIGERRIDFSDYQAALANIVIRQKASGRR
jgi:UDP-N-acetylmuramoyl-L-alanyl-D-glutamate--2,6-diaminopimelate ligase